jgi:DNA-directed RNA polymerase specialized sigma24 family protein
VTDTDDDEAAYTPEEMCAIIGGLSKGDMQRLALYAARFANTLPGTDPKDLLHHALLKASLGERQCPRDTAPITFLRNVMRSELFNLRRKSKQTESLGDQEPDFDEVDDDSPETWAERMDDLKHAMEEVQQAFGDDTRPMIVFEGRAEGLRRDEIRELLGLDPVAYESLEKKIRRFMNKRLSERRAI